jgi:hypothetical protein
MISSARAISVGEISIPECLLQVDHELELLAQPASAFSQC